MSWLLKFRIREFFQKSTWVIPLFFAFLAGIAGAESWRLDKYFGWEFFGFKFSGAVATVGAIIGAMITFTGFVFSILLVAVQFASAHLSPRVLKTSLNDRITQFSFGMFIATFIYSIIIIARIEENFIPQMSIFICLILVGVSIVMFLILINHVAQGLQAPRVVNLITKEGQKILEKMYKKLSLSGISKIDTLVDEIEEKPSRTILYNGGPGLVQAIDIIGLVKVAKKHDALIVLAPAVGDFILNGHSLFYLYEKDKSINERVLQNSVAIGIERTMQQDPTFVFRILVDIAIKAVSEDASDPTTAVIALDKIQGFLSLISKRELDAGEYFDGENILRLEMQTPTWEDYLGLALNEIRHSGIIHLQICRRLYALLDDLMNTVPEELKPAVQEQLDMLNKAVDNHYNDLDERKIASVPDYQGIGSSKQTGYRRKAAKMKEEK